MPSTSGDIITPRLILRLFGEAVTRACLHHDEAAAAKLFGFPLPPILLNSTDTFEHDMRQLQADAAYKPWASRAIMHKEEMKVMGLIRFHGKPASRSDKPYRHNAAELGYEIYPAYQRRGYAREAITGAMQWATKSFGIHSFIASVSPENTASLSLVQSLGFRKVDEEVDETDGLEYVFALNRSTTNLLLSSISSSPV